MRKDSISVAATVEAGADAVWRFLTVERAAWWPDMSFEAVVGSPLRETWIEGGEQRHAAGVITQCAEPRLLAFRWSEPEWEGSLDVVILLEPEGSATAVTITETGFTHARTPPVLADEHEDGWRYHLTRLKRVCESGSVDSGPP